jgi:hypothetical protein
LLARRKQKENDKNTKEADVASKKGHLISFGIITLATIIGAIVGGIIVYYLTIGRLG